MEYRHLICYIRNGVEVMDACITATGKSVVCRTDGLDGEILSKSPKVGTRSISPNGFCQRSYRPLELRLIRKIRQKYGFHSEQWTFRKRSGIQNSESKRNRPAGYPPRHLPCTAGDGVTAVCTVQYQQAGAKLPRCAVAHACLSLVIGSSL